MLVLLLVLLEVKWFYLPSNTNSILVRYNFEGKNLAIVIVSLSLLFMQLLLYKTRKRTFKFKNSIILLFIIWLFAFSYAITVYGQDISYTFYQFIYFGVYLLYFSILWYFEYADGYYYFSTVLSLCTAIFSILISIQAYVLQNGGEYFLTILEYINSSSIVTRHGIIRVMAPSALLSISAILSFARLFKSEKRNIYSITIDVINTVAGTIYVFYACGTRFLMLILIVTYGVILICKKQGTHLLRNIIIYFIIAYAIYSAISQNIFVRLAFSTTERSYTYRVEAFLYFLKIGILNPICGLGFLTDHAPQYSSLLHGPYGTYYISDVGICGFAGQMGIIAAITYFYMIFKIWKMNYSVKKHTGKFNPIILGVACYVTLSLFTISLQTNNTIIAMVLSLIYVEHEFGLEVYDKYRTKC